MKKTLLASAMIIALGGSQTARAATITINEMVFNGTYAVSGTLNDAGTGSMSSVDPFFGRPWYADQVAWFDTHDSTIVWDASSAANGGVYTFTLTGNQVAAGTYFDWGASIAIATLTIFDCPVSGGGSCSGDSLPWVNGPFAGQSPSFNGTTDDDFPISGASAVPVPAAAWLFFSGLSGLVGVMRRRQKRP